jgi:hypothetical protein
MNQQTKHPDYHLLCAFFLRVDAIFCNRFVTKLILNWKIANCKQSNLVYMIMY